MDRFQRGLDKLHEINKEGIENVTKTFSDICPDLTKYIVEFGYGDLYTRPGLDQKSRQIAIVASLITLGNATTQLKIHIKTALNVGCTQDEIKEIILQMAAYAGFPAAVNAMIAAREVFSALDESAV